MSEAVLAVALVWVAASGTAAVLTGDPLRQAFVEIRTDRSGQGG